MLALVLFFLLAVLVSFLSSLLEAVILSATYTHIQVMMRSGYRSGRILDRLKRRIGRPLAAILTMNTVAHTVGAAGVGAEIQKLFGNEWLAVGSIVLTLAILVFSEIIPKTLGAVYWRPLASGAAYTILFVVWLTYPFVVSFEALSALIARKGQRQRVTREEMLAVAELGLTEGSLHRDETRIIRNLLRLTEIRVKDILTPRSVLLAFQKDRTISDVVETETAIPFSRIPVYGEDIDDIAGLVLRYQVFESYARREGERHLIEISNPLKAVPESKTVRSVLNDFIAEQQHVYLVVDEYGGTVGIVTLEDAIETLLGLEIVDEFDTVADMRKWAREEWERRKRSHSD
jgi:CBS domain containing-hemolysin-like protein